MTVRDHASLPIPIPRILDWCDNSANLIKAEYIIMDFVRGVRLQDIWSSMSTLQHLQCTQRLTELFIAMSNVKMPAYGSLYLGDSIPDVHNRIVLPQAPRFCIGPHCGSMYWNDHPRVKQSYGKCNTNHGPCEYLRGL